jgi:nicotinate-nucleotide--dimethylbenzimidazole phosphoribosyltransferase
LEFAVKPIASAAYQHALAYQLSLTKPPGSLGQLEDLACRLCGMQNTDKPQLEKVHITVFAGDHGIAEEGISAFPQIVTREMVRNFAAGGAAISVLAKAIGAQFEVIDCGVCNDPGQLEGVVSSPVALGTANFAKGPAMTEEQLAAAMQIGRDAVGHAIEQGADCFIAGEMGIANTTAATTLVCALLGKPARQLAGPGTGLDAVGVAHKIEVIQKALDLHGSALKSPLDALRRLGGFEIAAIAGAYLAAAQAGLPVIVDGFIASSAALVATRINREVGTWWFYAHASAEPGHRFIMDALGAKPLLDLGMRLGEGSGAAVVVPLLRQACVLHNEMATFEQAGVSEKHD